MIVISVDADTLTIRRGSATLNGKNITVQQLTIAVEAAKFELPPKPMTPANQLELERCIIRHLKALDERQ